MLGRAYRGLLRAGAVAAALLLGVLALLVTGDVLARNLGLGTLPWIIEVSEYSLPLATFLVAPWLLHRNEHVRLDVLLTTPSGQQSVPLAAVSAFADSGAQANRRPRSRCWVGPACPTRSM